MAENSGISWTHHTHNPWLGCQRVSPGCEHCYAETLVTTRMRLPVWGPPKTTARKRTAVATRRKPFAWNRRAAATGVRERVFCASLADVFEDHPALPEWRAELFETIEATPALDWLLLTKRPQNLRAMLPAAWLASPRANVWLGATAEDQKRLDERAAALAATPAAVRFLSCEPLIESLDVRRWVRGCELPDGPCATCRQGELMGYGSRVSWVIVGGESGAKARNFDIAWARSILAQCRAARVAPFVKQLGAQPVDSAACAYAPQSVAEQRGRIPNSMWRQYGAVVLDDRAGADPGEWPADLRVQEFPAVLTAEAPRSRKAIGELPGLTKG